ncbi:MAG: hypothetical protein BWX80_03888 [Candidatus Hydrogenedentes bacterium ADurb.Bin101]|nr:MAG: hypothetical protein BWX80_03888 [Candidatus Hydrogenedentes bacterium ADurb.Bin101]
MHNRLAFTGPQIHRRQFVQPALRSGRRHQDAGGDVIDRLEFIQRADQVFCFPLAKSAAGKVDILLRQGSNDKLGGNTERLEPFHIQKHLDFLFLAALDLRLGDTILRFQIALQFSLRRLPYRGQGGFFFYGTGLVGFIAGRYRNPHDRVQSGIIPQNNGLAGDLARRVE